MGVQRLGQATYLNIGVYLLNTSHLIEKIALALLVARGKRLVNSISNLAKKTWFLWSPVAWAIQTVTLIRTSNFIIEKFLTNEDIPKEGALYISMILALPYTLYLVSRIRNSQENFSIIIIEFNDLQQTDLLRIVLHQN